MRLLPLPEVKQLRDEETERLVKERAAYADASAHEVKKFNALKAGIEQLTNEMNEHFKAEQAEQVATITTLKKEVKGLEERRKLALLPVTNEMEAARIVRLEVDKNLEKSKNEMLNVQLLRNKVDDELKEIKNTKSTLEKREELVALAETQFAKEKKRIMSAFDRRDKRITDKEAKIVEKETELSGREWTVAKELREARAIQEVCEKMREDIAKRERKLEHNQQVLASAWNEAKKKKII